MLFCGINQLVFVVLNLMASLSLCCYFTINWISESYEKIKNDFRKDKKREGQLVKNNSMSQEGYVLGS